MIAGMATGDGALQDGHQMIVPQAAERAVRDLQVVPVVMMVGMDGAIRQSLGMAVGHQMIVHQAGRVEREHQAALAAMMAGLVDLLTLIGKLSHDYSF